MRSPISASKETFSHPFLVASSSPEAETRIMDILGNCTDFEDVRRAGLLFHGTCEAIDGPLRGGAYDGVFWCAETPSVAQAYIPRAGIIRCLAMPNTSQADEPLRPTEPDDPVMTWALERAGATWDDLDVERDPQRTRSIRSWRNLPGWPDHAALEAWISDELGYGRPVSRIWPVLCDRDDAGKQIFRPSNWSMPGQLYVLHVPDLKIEPAPWSPEMMAYKPHNRLDDFPRFAREGLEAFSMHDQLQSDEQGNVGHRSIGLLSGALGRAEWIAIPAMRHDGADISIFSEPMTEAFAELMREARNDPRICASPEP